VIRVLVVTDFFPPADRSGGARSVAYLVSRLGDRFDFHVVCRDHDVGDREPFPGVPSGQWVRAHSARVLYLPRSEVRAASLLARIREVRPDLLHVNSVFSRLALRVLALRRLGLLGDLRLLLAPEGELSAGALAHHRGRKRAVLMALRASGAIHGLLWRASNAEECEEVFRVAGRSAAVRVAPEPLPAEILAPNRTRSRKAPGELRLAFVGRLAPKKNLPFLLDALEGVRGRIELDVYGPIEDAAEWSRCVCKAERLAPHVVLTHRGSFPHDQVAEALAGSHAFVLPTLGENFGHAILEALAAGLPVVVSDRTPWRGLAAKGAGWDLPLTNLVAWREVLGRLVAFDDGTLAAWSDGARRLALEVLADPASERENEAVLRAAASAPRRRP
jgi:glycosyltransferase involved in cell wall biosynthesis